MPDFGSDVAAEWTGRVGKAWAEQWRRTDQSFGALTDRILDKRAIGTFQHALDIGCGAGELIERLASAYPAAVITGIDISIELVAAARARCAEVGNTTVEVTDAGAWRADPGARPDLLISRHGVMFFAEPVTAFAHLRGQAAPAARLRFSCFRTRAENAWVNVLASVLPAPTEAPDPVAPGPFAFGDPNRVRAILAGAGWSDIAFEPVDYAMIAGEGEDAVIDALAYFQRIGPAARVLAEMAPDDRTAMTKRLYDALAAHYMGNRVSLPAAAWIVTARASPLVTQRSIA